MNMFINIFIKKLVNVNLCQANNITNIHVEMARGAQGAAQPMTDSPARLLSGYDTLVRALLCG